MNIKLFNVALGVALTATAISASAQKTYTSGVVSYSSEMQGRPADVKQYFTPDSMAAVITSGPATVKLLTDAKHDYFAVILDIPIANIKKAGLASPSEIEEAAAAYPTFTFTPGTETKVISGFNCKKVTAKNKDGKAYDVWVTTDVSTPATGYPPYYAGAGGFPIQYTYFQQGPGGSMQEVPITILSVTDGKAPAGTFAIASDIPKGTMADLMSQ
jgi:hypothetical protein